MSVVEQDSRNHDVSYHRVIVRVAVVDLHIVEERLHVLIKEMLHYVVVEVCVDKHGPDVCFDDVR